MERGGLERRADDVAQIARLAHRGRDDPLRRGGAAAAGISITHAGRYLPCCLQPVPHVPNPSDPAADFTAAADLASDGHTGCGSHAHLAHLATANTTQFTAAHVLHVAIIEGPGLAAADVVPVAPPDTDCLTTARANASTVAEPRRGA